MYKLLLILKYLRKRRIAWVSLIAVMLCTAMVLIVISVMGGWLRMFRGTFHGLSGDVIVEADSVVGFPYYQDMIDRIQKLPEVEAATPTLQTFGLVHILNIRKPVQVIGYKIDEIGKVNDFPKSLHRQYEIRKDLLLSDAKNAPPEKKKQLEADAENPPVSFSLLAGIPYEDLAAEAGFNHGTKRPGMIVGTGVVGIRKDEKGKMHRPATLYDAWAQLTLLQISPDTSRVDVAGGQRDEMFWIVDDSRTQVYQNDANTVYVSFDLLQKDLGMDAHPYKDEEGKQRIEPARTSAIQVKIRPGVSLDEANKKISAVVDAVQNEKDISAQFPLTVQTWEESQKTWLSAIENEKSLMTVLFGIISLVAVFLILCIFYMIVKEKTKDIGIIKSVGATNSGVAAIFLGYGLAIGLVGAAGGFTLGYLIVRYINELHSAFARLTGKPIWNPEVYAFDTIPNTMNPPEVIVILAIAVLASVIGAVVPAIAAARLNPVESLRFE